MSSLRRLCCVLCTVAVTSWAAPISGVSDLSGKAKDPFAQPAQARVFLFVRSDCPITNRYAPELQSLAREFAGRAVAFWLVYPDRTETPESIEKHVADYRFPGEVLRDPQHELVKLAHATVAPEAAVFDSVGRLVYHGRIDDRWVDIGKARPAAEMHDLKDAITAVLAGKPVRQPETRAVGCSLADLQ